MGGDGPWAVALMWLFSGLTFVFVVLRMYTRGAVIQNIGIDDHVYNFAFFLLLMYTICTTVAAHYGFGQNMFDIPVMDDLVNAILFEAVGQTFAVIGMAVAKWSLGLFLLRLVTEKWHKIAIWTMMLILMGASISVAVVFWLQCSPPAYLYDRRIPGGYCYINTTPVSYTLCISCVLADFFFAIFPWVFLWNLNMPKREKIVIAASLSLGLFAGACGIKRTVEVPSLISDNYLKDTVGLIVWSAAEIAVTMICIGIPVCRPLYKRFLDKVGSRDASGYVKQPPSGPRYGLKTFGGSTMPGRGWEGDEAGGASKSQTSSASRTIRGDHNGEGSGSSFTDVKLGINGPFVDTRAVAGGKGGARIEDDNSSEEEILGDEYRRKSQTAGRHPHHHADLEAGQMPPHPGQAIQVTEEWRVTVV